MSRDASLHDVVGSILGGVGRLINEGRPLTDRVEKIEFFTKENGQVTTYFFFTEDDNDNG